LKKFHEDKEESILKTRKITITQADYGRLRRIIASSRDLLPMDGEHLEALERELESAVITGSVEVPREVVTMNSRVRVLDLNSARELVYQIVFPGEADVFRRRISMIAPIGMELLGHAASEIIEWEVPSGMRRLLILEVEYQPEAARVAA
jgi:regulator of nucleoside diphosphate kinase